jgi:hypothetical protein
VTRAALRTTLMLLALLAPAGWMPASAQVLGVFRWQMQPYCNLVTFTVIQQQGPTYQLTGNDNMCGAPAFAPATGTATPNPNGTISLGFEIVTPSGATAHVSATVNVANVSGTWSDADGNAGAFAFNPAAVQGQPRPAPTRSTLITSAQLAASIFAGSGMATTVARSDHNHDDRYFTEAESNALVTEAVADAVADAVSAAAAVVVEDIAAVPVDLTPENVLHERTIATPKAGRLLINIPSNLLSYACSAANSYYVFLTLDGSVIRNSVVNIAGGGNAAHVIGVTPDLVPAGTHTVRLAARCLGSTWVSYTYFAEARVAILVLP